ncbi:hypothetical protein FGO68_gene9462 [Halteria grandinella]|uniref:Uncharacterized protein n=1 Tax=Halteria grandinella TaxID=5974 RepID=A0A8J8T3C3_HALGN|nr:hypothetical protein FGO68_gene9462 [Halteria grandinella]
MRNDQNLGSLQKPKRHNSKCNILVQKIRLSLETYRRTCCIPIVNLMTSLKSMGATLNSCQFGMRAGRTFQTYNIEMQQLGQVLQQICRTHLSQTKQQDKENMKGILSYSDISNMPRDLNQRMKDSISIFPIPQFLEISVCISLLRQMLYFIGQFSPSKTKNSSRMTLSIIMRMLRNDIIQEIR